MKRGGTVSFLLFLRFLNEVPLSITMNGTDNRSAYQYEPLSSGRNHIRVLDLAPAMDGAAPLHGKLRTVRLDHDDYPYEAISYTWGKPDFSHSLYITATHRSNEPRILRITPNLAELLRRMRYRMDTRTFWVDAICINQRDDDEKSRQIPIMAFIYRRAFQVNIWLSNDSHDKEILEFLNVYARRLAATSEAYSISSTDHKAALGCLLQLVGLPWFTRRWIVQEAVVNIDATVFCQTETMSLIRLFNLANQFKTPFVARLPSINSVLGMERLWNNHAYRPTQPAKREMKENLLAHGHSCQMAELMEQFDRLECEDPRDRIYALASLQSCVKVTPDYNKSPEEVFTQFAETMCDHGQLQWILKEASIRNTGNQKASTYDIENSVARLPSWVPDWTVRPLRTNITTDDLSTSPLSITTTDVQRQANGRFKITRIASDEHHGIFSYDPPLAAHWKGSPFPSNPTMEESHRWIKGVWEYCKNYFMREYSREATWLQADFRDKFLTLLSGSATNSYNSKRLSASLERETLPQSRIWEDYLDEVSRTMINRCVFACEMPSNDLDPYADLHDDFMEPRSPPDLAFGIGPSHLCIGDQLLLKSTSCSFLFRECSRASEQTTACYELIGECTVNMFESHTWDTARSFQLLLQ